MEAVEHGVDAEGEEVRVVLAVDAWGDACPVGRGFVGVVHVSLNYPGEADFELEGTVLVEVVVPDVLCDGKEVNGVIKMGKSGNS